MAALLRLEDLTLEIGFQLIPLVDEKQGGQLLGRVRTLRRHLSSEWAFWCPRSYLRQPAAEAPRVPLFAAGLEIGRWQTEGDQLLAVSGEPGRRPLAGKEAREPAFGVPAIWIAPGLEDQAIAAGYSVVDAVTVITTHLGELIRRQPELLGRAETKRLMDALNESHPKLMEELVPKLLSLGEVGRVSSNCCASGSRFATWARFSRLCSRPRRWARAWWPGRGGRQALGRRLIRPLLDARGQLPVLLLDPALEEEILATLSPETGQRLLPRRARRDPAGQAVLPILRDNLSARPPPGPSRASVLVRPAITFKRWLEPGCRVWRLCRRRRFLPRFVCARWEQCAERGPCGSER